MKEIRDIDLSAWTKVGEGGNGSAYENPAEPDVILKVNKAGINTLAFVSHEYEVSKAVERLGVQTPKMYEMVRVGDAYATLCQRIRGKKSLSRICCDEAQRTEEMARVLCEYGRKLFSTPCDTSVFPSRKAQLKSGLDKVRFVRERDLAEIEAFARTVPEVETCIHGDFNTGNLIFSEGAYYWIDLDRFGYGDPMFDIGHLFQICNVYSPMKRVQDIFHMSEDQLRLFWDAIARACTGKDDHAEFDRLAGKFACLDMILRYEFQEPSLPEKIFFAIHIRRLVRSYFL